MVKAQEGVLIETRGGLIFYVRGHVHPPGRVIAFPRYIPDPSGDRERGGVRYRRVGSLAEQISAVVQNAPSYMAHDAVFDQD
ncbi:TPA: hypothetical protein EYP44_05850, partial [Candidatus Bathyarchaeota archaeon]|nr:hypothetical protein [Candidatus Bathyarchaeota archaeon]